jgi:hypothetical protein
MTFQTDVENFQLKRFPSSFGLVFMLYLVLKLIFNQRYGYFGLVIACPILIYLVWRSLGPAPTVSISKSLASQRIIFSDGLQLDRQQIEEISPSSKGLNIMWRKGGVAIYHEVHESSFDNAIWPSFYRAVYTWAGKDLWTGTQPQS